MVQSSRPSYNAPAAARSGRHGRRVAGLRRGARFVRSWRSREIEALQPAVWSAWPDSVARAVPGRAGKPNRGGYRSGRQILPRSRGWIIAWGAIGIGEVSDHTIRRRAARPPRRADWPGQAHPGLRPGWRATPGRRRPPWWGWLPERSRWERADGSSTGAGLWSFTADLPDGSPTESASTR